MTSVQARYEYKYIRCVRNTVEREVNKLAREGYRVVMMNEDHHGSIFVTLERATGSA